MQHPDSLRTSSLSEKSAVELLTQAIEQSKDANDVDSEVMNLGDLLDDMDMSPSAITSNIAQLAQQRINGQVNGPLDLSESMMPSSVERRMDNDTVASSIGSDKTDSVRKETSNAVSTDTEYNSFKYWRSNYYEVDDASACSIISSPVLESRTSLQDFQDYLADMKLNPSVEENGEAVNKFMERHLGVGNGSTNETVKQASEEENYEKTGSVEENDSKHEHGHPVKERSDSAGSNSSDEQLISARGQEYRQGLGEDLSFSAFHLWFYIKFNFRTIHVLHVRQFQFVARAVAERIRGSSKSKLV